VRLLPSGTVCLQILNFDRTTALLHSNDTFICLPLTSHPSPLPVHLHLRTQRCSTNTELYCIVLYCIVSADASRRCQITLDVGSSYYRQLRFLHNVALARIYHIKRSACKLSTDTIQVDITDYV